ncbi:hypothetical protein JCM11251_006909 [Rhodosporidiobolus azoricus]
MSSSAPLRALRSALHASARPTLSAALYSRPSSLLAATAPIARQPHLLVPSLLASRHGRGFASSASAAGWLNWGKEKKEELKEQAVEAKEVVEDKAASLTPSSSEPAVTSATSSPTPVEAASEPTIVSTAPVDISTSAVTPPPVSALEGNFYDGIYTGTLDLSSLSGAWGPHPIMRIQSLFLHLHESFPLLGHGLTWAVLIPVVTVFLRLFLFPFQVRSQANAGRMAIIQPQMLSGMNKLKEAKARGDFAGMQTAQMEVQQLMKKHDVNPIRNLVFPLAQAAVFTCMFFALRGLAEAGLPSMTTEGFGWVTDLTQRDPYWILPVMSSGLTLATLETGVDGSTQVQTATTKNMKAIFRVLLVVALPFIAYFPAALLTYWVSNNFLSLLQTSVLKLHSVRRLLNIPTPPPKPQPGDANYIPEPSFSQAFKDMQMGLNEKWEETKVEAEKKQKVKDRWESAGKVTAEVYTPRKPVASKAGLSQAAQELLETGTTSSRVIEASPVGAQEAERNRRVAEARRRRLGRK